MSLPQIFFWYMRVCDASSPSSDVPLSSNKLVDRNCSGERKLSNKFHTSLHPPCSQLKKSGEIFRDDERDLIIEKKSKRFDAISQNSVILKPETV